jgi:hypothetical protein
MAIARDYGPEADVATVRKTLLDSLTQLAEEINQSELALNMAPSGQSEGTAAIDKVSALADAVDVMIGKMRRINEALRGL